MSFNHLEDVELYFGSVPEQQDMIDVLTAAAQAGRSQMHMVSGPSNTGKSSVIESVGQNLASTHGGFKETREMPPELEKLIDRIEADPDFNDMQLNVYKKEGATPTYVVLTDGEFPPLNPKALSELKNAIALVQHAGKKNYNLVWIADAPMLNQSASIFKRPLAEREAKQHHKIIEKLQKSYGDTLAVHTLHYDMKQIRTNLWEHIQSDGEQFINFLKGGAHWDETPQWKRTYEAALKGNEESYNKYFDTLVERTRPRGKAA